MERCREAGSNWTEREYYFDPETGIMYKNCTIKKNGKSYNNLMKMVYTQLYPQQIRKNKKMPAVNVKLPAFLCS